MNKSKEDSKPRWAKPNIVKDLESFAHRYPITKVVRNKTVTVPDPLVLKDAERIEQFMKNKFENPTAHCTTW